MRGAAHRRSRLVLGALLLVACDESALPDRRDAGAPTPKQEATWRDVDAVDDDPRPVWSNDRSLVAIGGVVLRVADGQIAMTFEGVPLAFDPEGDALAVGARVDASRTEDANAERPPGFRIVTSNGVRATSDEARFVSWATPGTAYLVEKNRELLLGVGEDRLVPLGKGAVVGAAEFDATGKLLLHAMSDGTELRVIEAATGETRATLRFPSAPTSFGWVGDHVYACDDKDMVRIASVDAPRDAAAFKAKAPSCEASPRVPALVVAQGNRVTILDLQAKPVVELKPAGRHARTSFDASGTHVAIARDEAGVDLVDLEKRATVHVPGEAARYHPERALLFLEGESSVDVRDEHTLAIVASMRGSHSPFDATSPFWGESLMATAHDAAITLWDLDRGARLVSAVVTEPGLPRGRWSYSLPVVGPRFVSFVRARPSRSNLPGDVREAVFTRVADGARVLVVALADGKGTRRFVHTEGGEFDVDDAGLDQVMLVTKDGHEPASSFLGLRRPGLFAAFLRGDPIAPR